MYKVSVIIPVYKTEKYLRQCVDSVLNQTYKDIEIILVDDGSPDQCGQLCDEYEKLHENVKVIHKENGGLSDARNAGVKVAQGEYLMFLDSDDYWQRKTGLQQLMHQLEEQQCDILNFHYVKQYEDTGKTESAFPIADAQKYAKYNRTETFIHMVADGQYIASACNKIIRKSLFEENDLDFRKGVFSEDVEWCARLAICGASYGISNLELYVYRQRTASITHELSRKNLEDLKNHIITAAGHAEGLSDGFKNAYLSYVAYQYAVFFVSAGYVGKQDMRELYREMKQYVYLFDYDASPKVKQMKKIYRLSGYKGLCLAGRIYAKIRK